jgi:hypothetical protein
VKIRIRRHVRRPPDLTSLFDVLFIVVFVALIRAAAAQQASAQVPKPPDIPKIPPPEVAVLRAHALDTLKSELDNRSPLVIRISETGTISGLETADKKLELDVPLLEHSPDPDQRISYLGDRSAELRLCRIAAVHLELADLSKHLVIVSPVQTARAIQHTLSEGLRRDLTRCLIEQHGIATIVDPAALPPPETPPPSP